ncbi:MAG: ATP-binding protein [Carnobacterium sp.]|nr:ATP-binding protein [Carnobacterium sp.]
MLYKDLVNFEPIDSVIQLTDANNTDKAMHLLDTYVISDRMANTIKEVVFKQLQFKRPEDNKGLLVVGNYGSGKSHFMSMISTIAEYEGSSAHISNPTVAKCAKEIEGQFKVIRFEIGGVSRSLKDIIISQLTKGLKEMEVSFEFPKDDFNLTNNKEWLLEMMSAFNNEYPEKGLLLVVDELLDYLRSRKELELTLDLGFLRELGEVAHDSRFRFIAGIQEMLFDNPRFAYVADSLRRVKERFEQVRIVKEDIAFVVSQRLLKKDDEQKAKIREHLIKFTNLYERFSEDMDTYVDLFPIHPAYLTTFENVHNIEKRVALKTITNEMKKIIDQTVPSDNPGLISYDSYWTYIEEDPSNKIVPEIREVMDKSKIIKDRINSAFPTRRRMYKEMSIRIVNALSLNRITTDDVYSNLGMTSNELKDDLFLTIPGQMDFLLEDPDPAGFLKTNIDVAIKAIMETVSYQYISVNEGNGQYYLDLKKDIDVDSLIADRAEIIEADTMDRYYFDLLQNVIALNDLTYISGYKIWSHELPWERKRVMRKGYLFLGSPNERSTAQPERDFYIYMLRPFNSIKFKNENRSDEVFFKLNTQDEFFTTTLRKYAAAKEQYIETTLAQKQLFKNKYDNYFKQLNKWLHENFVNAFKVIYKGKEGFLSDFGIFLPAEDNLKALVNYAAAEFLGNAFEKEYPEYPTFNKFSPGYLTGENMKTAAGEALQYLNGRQTKTGEAIVNGLVMEDSTGNVTDESIANSGYSRWIIALLDEKGKGKVVNYKEIYDQNALRGSGDRRLSKEFKIEPELIVVIIGALLSSGKLEVSISGKNYTAMNFREFITKDIEILSNFDYIKKPTGLPIEEINAILNMFGEYPPNFDEKILEGYIKRLISSALDEITLSLKSIEFLKKGFYIANNEVMDSNTKQDYVNRLNSYKDFCEKIKRYDSVAKMKNFPIKLSEINEQIENKKIIIVIEHLKKDIDEVSSLVGYITQATYNYGLESDWSKHAKSAIKDVVMAVKFGENIKQQMTNLKTIKSNYIDDYFEIHQKSLLTSKEEIERSALLKSPEMSVLMKLNAQIDILPDQQLNEWIYEVQSARTCFMLTKAELEQLPTCKHCNFEISKSNRHSKETIINAKDNLTKIYDHWISILVDGLMQPSLIANLELLNNEEKIEIQHFIQDKELELPVSSQFLKTINSLFKGFEKVEVTQQQLIIAMGDGSPMSINELEHRIQKLITDLTEGKEKEKVRIMYKG